MYNRFDPLGVALSHEENLAAFTPGGQAVGHCFLAPDSAASAELAVFVDRDFRGRGVGTALVRAALEWAGMEGFRRVWALTSPDNQAALRLQERCGFRLRNFGSSEVEMVAAELSVPLAGRVTAPEPPMNASSPGGCPRRICRGRK
jgi:GNAT superfamily N-acetyltransferase